MTDNVHKGHRARMKAQFRQCGADRFESHQLLELLLFYAVPQKDTNPIAHRLLHEFGDLNGVFNASFEDLCQIKGVSEHTATLLMLCGQLLPRYYLEKQERRPLKTEKEVAEFLRPHFINQPKEKVVLLCLNNRNEPLSCSVVGQGSINAAEASVREIIECALRAKATAVVLAHNHPAGYPIPSPEDIAVTRSICHAMKMVEISVADHLIFAEKEYLSLRRQAQFAPLFSATLAQMMSE